MKDAAADVEHGGDVAGDGPVDVEVAADLAARPEERLWLRLQACTTMVESRLGARLRAGHGATLPRFELLAVLDKAPEPLSMGELSKRLMVSNGNVTGIVNRLVRDGLAVRGPGPADRRTQFVRITPEGRETCRAIAAAQRRWLAEMMTDLPREDMSTLLTLLGRLKEAVRGDAGADGDADGSGGRNARRRDT